jgi:hypothetical protein
MPRASSARKWIQEEYMQEAALRGVHKTSWLASDRRKVTVDSIFLTNSSDLALLNV